MFDFLQDIFRKPPYPPNSREEINRLIQELIQIGETDDFLSERPGHPFNMQCRHIRARQIGTRLDELGGLELMLYVHNKVKSRLGKTLIAHLEYCWAEIGKWVP